jgi:hypothetical protein
LQNLHAQIEGSWTTKAALAASSIRLADRENPAG